MKKSDIKKTLEQIEDYEAFYDREEGDQVESKGDEEEDNLDHLFVNENERKFYEYGRDIEFVKFHKRTTKNFKITLQELIDSPKMTMTRGVAKDY